MLSDKDLEGIKKAEDDIADIINIAHVLKGSDLTAEEVYDILIRQIAGCQYSIERLLFVVEKLMV